MSQISFQNVTKRFENGHEALAEVNADFSEGSMTFLTGHSGAGKSTFLKLLIRAQRPSRGRILVNGIDVGTLSEKRLPRYRQHIGVVFQDHHLLATRNVFDNVAIPLRVAGMGEREIARRVRAVLTSVELLGKEGLQPRHLSTGEQQRVGIARAVVTRPRILLADEPTGNLDPDLSRHIMGLFARFNQVGTTVIIVTHDVSLIGEYEARVLHLEEGRIVSGQTQAGSESLGEA
ncbi:MAG: cell division transport system ATP-binding protein [Limisphaerales bacterium]|jgi:cell division transport system ATP-binding protein